METILQKVATLWPEVAMLTGAVVCLFLGLARSAAMRRATPVVAAITLVVAGALLFAVEPRDPTGVGLGGMTLFVKAATVVLGLILLMVGANVPWQTRQNRLVESATSFDPTLATGGEFFAFFLFSLTGVMLTAGAGDLAWLFLAIELSSLPTYVMVATMRDRIESQEAGVKYFFLAALSVAIFLYGFTLIYGATGHTTLDGIQRVVADDFVSGRPMSPLLLMGIVLSIAGLCFKIAAVPMHYYTADVYQGAATPVTAFIAWVPKATGFVAMILILSLVGWPLDRTPDVVDGGDALVWMLWILAALTMTVGNVLALLQNNVKRVLAYSSIAQSGYMLVGLLAGPAAATLAGQSGALTDGLAGVLFYLVAYGLATVAAFAVLGCLSARGEEAQTYDDLSGLAKRHPVLGVTMLLAMLSLLGIPPLVGFLGKIYLFAPALSAGYLWLVVIAAVNSAISAGYYLHIAAVCFFGTPAERVEVVDLPMRRIAAAAAAIAAVLLGFAGGGLAESAQRATGPTVALTTPLQPQPLDQP